MAEAVGGIVRNKRVFAVASQGRGSGDEERLRALLSGFEAKFIDFDRDRKKEGFLLCLRTVRLERLDLLVIEGTGIAVGLAAILGHIFYGTRYILSSGDAVGPFLSASFPLGAPIFGAYERMLYRCSSGFIGWTPYLVGRALSLGGKRGMSAPGWAPYEKDLEALATRRKAIREQLKIPSDAVVFGIVGALVWSSRYKYCYGLELVRAARKSGSKAYVLIVGDGSGLAHLRELAGDALDRTIFLVGRKGRDQVPGYLAAMDIASLPQSVDSVGSFRYSTKIAEYRSVGLPFITNEVPMAYDLDRGDIRRLPGDAPWSRAFTDALTKFMETATLESIGSEKGQTVAMSDFDREIQIRRVTDFILDILNAQ